MHDKKFFCGFEPAKMHCKFTFTTNAFQDESWDLSNSKGYEFDRTHFKLLQSGKDTLRVVTILCGL